MHTFISILLFLIRIQSYSFIGFRYSYLGTSNNCKTFCLQWLSYMSCPSSTYWSIWRVFISANYWWASMHSISLFFLFMTIPFCTIYTNIHVDNVGTLKLLDLPSCCHWVLHTYAFIRELTLKSMLILIPKVCLLYIDINGFCLCLSFFLKFRSVIGMSYIYIYIYITFIGNCVCIACLTWWLWNLHRRNICLRGGMTLVTLFVFSKILSLIR